MWEAGTRPRRADEPIWGLGSSLCWPIYQDNHRAPLGRPAPFRAAVGAAQRDRQYTSFLEG